MIRTALKKAERLHEQRRYLDAIEVLNEVVDDGDASLFEVFAARGYAKSALGDSAAALEDFGAAIARQPAEPALYFARGREHIDARLYREGIDDMTRAIQADEALGSTYYRDSAKFVRAVAYFLLGERQRARDACIGLVPGPQTYIARRLWKLADING